MTLNLRIGLPEVVTMGSLLLLAALIVLFIVEWPVGLIPAVTYAVASVGSYAGYRQYVRERSKAEEGERIQRFRVVETRGVCPLGHRTGDVLTVSGADVAPFACPEATAVLRAASEADGDPARKWCCPVYDHLLVFEKQRAAA
jgi:uncharacterized repeat protein (TIGR04076 family)